MEIILSISMRVILFIMWGSTVHYLAFSDKNLKKLGKKHPCIFLCGFFTAYAIGILIIAMQPLK